MNKNYENNIILKGGVVDLDRHTNSAVITVKDTTVINAINLHNNFDLKIKVEKGVLLIINYFDYADTLSVNLEVECSDNSNFILNAAFIAEHKYELNINTLLYGNNITANANIRGIDEREGIVKIEMNGTVAGETKGNVLNEYARIINKSEMSNVLIPNLIVNTNEVEANHGISIGKIDDEELFYLMSKGIDKSHATKLIEEGFILAIMPDGAKEIIKNILMGR